LLTSNLRKRGLWYRALVLFGFCKRIGKTLSQSHSQ
jgi:hypothetical protein